MQSQFIRIKDLAINKFKDLQDKPDVYIVFWTKNGKPIVIGRICGEDQGVLYIGSLAFLKT